MKTGTEVRASSPRLLRASRKTRRRISGRDAFHGVPPLKFIDRFRSIGGFRYAFERAGGQGVFSSDGNEPAQITYEEMHAHRPALVVS